MRYRVPRFAPCDVGRLGAPARRPPLRGNGALLGHKLLPIVPDSKK